MCAVQPGTLPAFLLARNVDGGVASTPEVCRLLVRAPHPGEKHVKFTKLTPNLVVRGVQAAVQFYQSVLGFQPAITVPDAPPYRRDCFVD